MKAYSLDLRERVVGAVRNGLPVSVAARVFSVSRATTRRWVHRTTVGAPLGPLDVLPTVQAAWQRGARFTPAAGLELGYWPVTGRTFFLRAGVRRPDAAAAERAFTLGAGFSGDRIAIDYALAPLRGGRATHRVGLRWR